MVIVRTLPCPVLSFGLYTHLFVLCVHCLLPAFGMLSTQRSQVTPHSFSPGPSPGSPRTLPTMVGQPWSVLTASHSLFLSTPPQFGDTVIQDILSRAPCPYSPSDFGRPDSSLSFSHNSSEKRKAEEDMWGRKASLITLGHQKLQSERPKERSAQNQGSNTSTSQRS